MCSNCVGLVFVSDLLSQLYLHLDVHNIELGGSLFSFCLVFLMITHW